MATVLVFVMACEPKEEPAPLPSMESVGNKVAKVGDTLSFSGNNFGEDKAAVNVQVGGTEAVIAGFSPTNIDFIVPSLEKGEYPGTLKINNASVETDARIKVYPRVENLSFNKESADNFETVEVSAAGLPGTAADYRVTFNDLEVSAYEKDGNTLKLFIPSDVLENSYDVVLHYKEVSYPAGTFEVSDWLDNTLQGYSFALTENESFPVHMVDTSGFSMLPHLNEGGTVAGVMVKQGSDDDFTYIALNENDAPKAAYFGEYVAIFDGYDLERGTVNFSLFDKSDQSTIYSDFEVPLPEAELNKLRSLAGARLLKANSYSDALQAAGLGVSLTSCAISFAGLPAGPIGWFGIAASCGGALYSVVETLNPAFFDENSDNWASSYGLSSSAFGCGSLLLTRNPQQLVDGTLSCIDLSIAAGQNIIDLSNLTEQELADLLTLIRNSLTTGYGDINVTLSWNQANDIDLWVTDPNGEMIVYYNRNSSSGGELDYDDTDGYGPENIYWPSGEAPTGDYLVNVHYYGPTNGPATTYRVAINNFGVTKIYEGVLSNQDDVHTIATFTAGQGFRINAQQAENLILMKAPKPKRVKVGSPQ